MDVSNHALFQKIIGSEKGKSKLQQFAQSIESDNYDDFLNVLYQKLHDIFIALEESRDKYFSHDEDSITSIIAGRLQEAGYDASEQTKKNGAVDLTVKLDRHKWIAEAKIAYSNSKILEGLLQLLTRYVTRDTDAGLLIYIKKPKTVQVIEQWHEYLKNSNDLHSYLSKKKPEILNDLKCIFERIETTTIDPHNFSSRHNLVSGSSIKVRHFCANLYFNPGDSSGNKGQKQREDNARNNLANLYFEHLASDTEFDTESCINYLEQLFRELDPDDIIQVTD